MARRVPIVLAAALVGAAAMLTSAPRATASNCCGGVPVIRRDQPPSGLAVFGLDDARVREALTPVRMRGIERLWATGSRADHVPLEFKLQVDDQGRVVQVGYGNRVSELLFPLDELRALDLGVPPRGRGYVAWRWWNGTDDPPPPAPPQPGADLPGADLPGATAPGNVLPAYDLAPAIEAAAADARVWWIPRTPDNPCVWSDLDLAYIYGGRWSPGWCADEPLQRLARVYPDILACAEGARPRPVEFRGYNGRLVWSGGAGYDTPYGACAAPIVLAAGIRVEARPHRATIGAGTEGIP